MTMLTRRGAAPLVVVVAFTLSMLSNRLAFAQPTGDGERVSVTVLIGVDPMSGGTFTRGAETSGRFGVATVVAHSLGEVQRSPIRLGVDVGYALSRTSDILARVAFTAARSRGAFDYGDSFILDTGEHLKRTATLSGYRGWMIQGGFRRIWRRGRVDPYLGGLAGVTVVEPMTLQGTAGDVTFGGPFFSRSVPLTLSAIAGVAVGVSPRLSVGVESGAHYQTALTVDPSAAQYTIGPADYYAFSRWSIPVTGTVRYRF